MSTVKYQMISPYQREKVTHHSSDYNFAEFLDSFKLKTKEDTEPIGVVICGIGRAGTIHLRNCIENPLINILYVIEDSDERSEVIRQNLNFSSFKILKSDKVSTAFEDERVDLVIIATPTYTHESLVRSAIKAKKAVFCEKPLCKSLEGTKELYAIAEKEKLPLMCAFNRRFDPSFSAVKNDIQDGKLGQIHIIKTVARDCPLPSIDYIKTSGGFIFDCGIHDIDIICWILGEYPEEVSAIGSNFISEIKSFGDCDTVCFIMKFPSGTISSTDLSRNAVYGYDQRLEVLGEKGMLQVDNDSPSLVSFSAEDVSTQHPICHSFPSRYSQAYKRQIYHCINLVKGKETALVKGNEVLKTFAVAKAVDESYKKRCLVQVDYSSC